MSRTALVLFFAACAIGSTSVVSGFFDVHPAEEESDFELDMRGGCSPSGGFDDCSTNAEWYVE